MPLEQKYIDKSPALLIEAIAYYTERYNAASDNESKQIWLRDIKETVREYKGFCRVNKIAVDSKYTVIPTL